MQIPSNSIKRFGLEACQHVEKLMQARKTKPWSYFYSNFFANTCPAQNLKHTISIVKKLLRFSSLENPSIISIGGGTRDCFAFVFEWLGFDPLFTDFSNAPLLLLKSENKKRKTRVVDAKKMPFPTASVDVITEFWFFNEPSLGELEHQKIAEEISRVLKCGGFILASEHVIGICNNFSDKDYNIISILINNHGFKELADNILQKP